ncbi:methyltransferase [Streptomyces sp. NPDC090499]|uniref:methyltransferase n=1 Tax=Streptomyces sp. NPDC090499 TaxID=3365965 RepID=UPI003814945F
MDVAFNLLTRHAFGQWQGQCLFTLAELRVFDTLAHGPLSAPRLAERCGTDPGVTERVLDAGTALGLLTKTDGAYANSRSAARFLVTESAESLAHWVRAMGQWAGPWSRLTEVVRTGLSQTPADTGGAVQRDFILGMHEFARRTASGLPGLAGLKDPRHLVDVGGGAGTYSLAFCAAYPDLRATVLDLADVLPVLAETAAHAGLADRVTGQVTDYRTDAFGTGADAVLFSNVLHQEPEDVVISMLRRGAAALGDPDTGRVLVHGHFLSEDHTAPLFSTLHNLSAVLLWGAGRSYTAGEMRELMRRAGLDSSEPQQVPDSTTQLIVGTAVPEELR